MKKKSNEFLFFNLRGKKAMSVMIAYIILISIALAISPFVYKYLKTYIEGRDVPECPEDVSLFVKKLNRTYKDDQININITLKNTGLFNIGGYLIKTSDKTDSVAARDISQYVQGNFHLDPGVMFKVDKENEKINSLSPGEEATHLFIIPNDKEINLIEITPIMWYEDNGKTEISFCDNSKIREIIKGTGF